MNQGADKFPINRIRKAEKNVAQQQIAVDVV
jgi:hypothetical protein